MRGGKETGREMREENGIKSRATQKIRRDAKREGTRNACAWWLFICQT